MRLWPSTVLFIAAVTVCVAGLWGEVLLPTSWSGGAARQVAFRDAAHFYYPLHQHLKAEWRSGAFPVQRDIVGNIAGESILANPTSGVFYPPAWFCFVLFPTPLDEHLFIVVHIVLAAWTAFRLARSLACSQLAATLAAIAYAMSGSVLFQQHNVIFLIGAAWFPEAIRLVIRIVKRGQWRHTFALATVIALTLFGGDWQAVYHIGLFALAACFWTLFDFTRTRRRNVSLLLAAFLIAFVATLVQTIPTLYAIAESDRASDFHRARIDNYSLPPWRLLEFVFPNFSGEQFPQHCRWTFAAEPVGIWTPSLYAGLIPAVLAMASLRLWGKRRLVVLTWCFIVAATASLGSAGGLYTILTQLPFYEMFRYPAKWLTVAALPFALLAAHSLDTLALQAATVRRVAMGTGVLVAAMMVGVPQLLCSTVPPCPLFGIFQAEKAYMAFVYCGAWSGGLALFVAALVRWQKTQTAAVLIVAVTVIDVVTMNRGLVPTVAHRAFDIEQATPLAAAIIAHHDSPEPPRIFRAVSYRAAWKTSSSPQRLEEWIRRDVATLAPRYHWLLPRECGVNVIATTGTTMLRRDLRESLEFSGGLLVPRDWASAKRLQIDFFLLDATSPLPTQWSEHLEEIAAPLPSDVKLWRAVSTSGW